ncbi:MAG: adenylyltransferase/cytidyltransferase family protein [Gaiellales bacterium]
MAATAAGDEPANGDDPGRSGLGVIHGRFQPFHTGHLEYLRLAAERSTNLVVGITNPENDAGPAEPSDPARFTREANLFSYWERLGMIEAVLEDEGIRGAYVIPFPIEHPGRLAAYVPPAATHYLRVFDEWGWTKVRRLEGAGYRVVVLQPGATKTISGAEVRARLAGGGAWESLVPPGTARVIRALGLA